MSTVEFQKSPIDGAGWSKFWGRSGSFFSFPFAADRCHRDGGAQSIILFVLYTRKIQFLRKGSLFLNRSRFDKMILYSALNSLILSVGDGCLFLFISSFVFYFFSFLIHFEKEFSHLFFFIIIKLTREKIRESLIKLFVI